jgi:DNA-binding transcriptional LysR family regulator
MKTENLNLSALKYFLDTVELGSLTKSADRNNVSRPAVSQAIRRLEDWAGQALLTHEKKTFELTEEGQAFYRRMKTTFESLKQSIEDGDVGTRSLKIGCSVSLAEQFLIPALKRMKKLESARIMIATAANLKHRLEDGSINIALYIGDKETLAFQSRQLVVGRFALGSRSGKLTMPIVTSEARPEVNELKKVLLREGGGMTAAVTAESWVLCSQLAQIFDGTCLIPEFLVKPPLKPVSLKGFKFGFSIFAAHRAPELLSEFELELLENLRP